MNRGSSWSLRIAVAAREARTAVMCARDSYIGGDRFTSDIMRELLDVEAHQEEENILSDDETTEPKEREARDKDVENANILSVAPGTSWKRSLFFDATG